MLFLLKLRRLLPVVLGEELEPAEGDAAKLAEWRDKDLQAQGEIMTCLGNLEWTAVDGLNTSREVWLRLLSLYEDTSKWRRWALHTKLNNIKLAEGGSMAAHLQLVKSLVSQINSMTKNKVYDDDVGMAILIVCLLLILSS